MPLEPARLARSEVPTDHTRLHTEPGHAATGPGLQRFQRLSGLPAGTGDKRRGIREKRVRCQSMRFQRPEAIAVHLGREQHTISSET